LVVWLVGCNFNDVPKLLVLYWARIGRLFAFFVEWKKESIDIVRLGSVRLGSVWFGSEYDQSSPAKNATCSYFFEFLNW
jgi:hypothetical protein